MKKRLLYLAVPYYCFSFFRKVEMDNRKIRMMVNVDNLGRIVIPNQIRKELNIIKGSMLEVLYKNGTIIIIKRKKKCIICNSETELRKFKGKPICIECIKALST